MDSVEGRGGQSPEARGAARSPGRHHCCRARVVPTPHSKPRASAGGGKPCPAPAAQPRRSQPGPGDNPVASQATARSCDEHQVDHCASWCRHTRLKIAGGTSSAAWDLTPVGLGTDLRRATVQRPVLHTHPPPPLFVRVPGPSARVLCVCARPRVERRQGQVPFRHGDGRRDMQRGEGDSAGPMSFSTKK